KNAIYRWDKGWKALSIALPDGVRLVDGAGSDLGLRFVDLDEDGDSDIVFSNENGSSVHVFDSLETGWGGNTLAAGEALPPITVAGANNGVFFHSRSMWLVNETTGELPDWAEPHSFNELLGHSPVTAKSPEEALASLHLRPGYTAELVVSEPLVMDPVSMEWGADGALWVMEMRDYPRGLDEIENKPGSRVRLLRDTDGDGTYDKSTIFLDGLGFANGVHPWRNGVLITVAPHILFAADTDGDDVADVREILYEGFGEGNQQHRVNGLRWGLDNWLHGANGDSSGSIRALKSDDAMNLRGRDLRIQPDTGRIDALAGQTQHGRSRDDWGNWFGCSNSNQGYHYALENIYTRRNPHIPIPDARVTLLRDRSTYPVSRLTSRFNDFDQANKFTSVCGLEVYRGSLFGAPFQRNIFFCEPVHNTVSRAQVIADGTTFTGNRAPGEEASEFFSSTDNWFRPVMVRNGPDGALWVADMYRETIEHPEYISEMDQARTDFTLGNDMGRIYRIFPVDSKPTPFRRLDTLSAPELATALGDPNPWVRDTAQRLLFERQDTAALPVLKSLATESDNPLARLHALHTLEGMKALRPELLLPSLQADTLPSLKRHAIRLSEPFLNESDALAERVLAAAKDEDAQVRQQVAYSLGELDGPRAAKVLGNLLEGDGTDPYLATAVLSSLQGDDLPFIVDNLVAYSLNPAISNDQAKRVVSMTTRMAELYKHTDLLGAFAAAVTKIQNNTPATRNFVAVRALIRTARQDSTREAFFGGSGILAPLTAAARTIAEDSEQPDALRLDALELLGRESAHREGDREILKNLVDPRESLAVAEATIQALARMGGNDALEPLLANWKTYTRELRGKILDVLLGLDGGVQLVVAHLESGAMTVRQLNASQRQRLLTHPDATIQKRVESLMAGVVDNDRVAVVARFRAAADLAGDLEQGRPIYEELCSKCHKIGDMGFVVGPDLAAAGSGSFETLITSILDPNRSMTDRYTNYTVETTNLESFAGVLANESANDITLINAGGVENTVLRTEIESMTEEDMSIMPLGLEEGLSEQDMANLIAFIRGKAPEPKSFPENTPALVAVDSNGVLQLTAENAEIYGDTLVYESDYHNLGQWYSANDHAVWNIETDTGGTFDVVMEYCCDKTSTGNAFRMEVGKNLLTGKGTSTGSWDRYFTKKIGRVHLAPGEQRVVFRPDGPLKERLIELRGLRLEPVK
ncbi:MAG: HEAT repeat domain-containing protein, partial [Candidatus Hydrogenedentes bacterium]|nr:HEAT repeat domain-containing protein [Candidatus Hydrogenedentota bacterium]